MTDGTMRASRHAPRPLYLASVESSVNKGSMNLSSMTAWSLGRQQLPGSCV